MHRTQEDITGGSLAGANQIFLVKGEDRQGGNVIRLKFARRESYVELGIGVPCLWHYSEACMAFPAFVVCRLAD